MEMREKVVLASCILEVETVNHEIGAIDPFQVL